MIAVKSTLATWCRELSPSGKQINEIKKRTGERARIPDTQRRRRAEIAQIRRRATERIDALINAPFWLSGVVLYWDEGARRETI